MQVTSKMEYTTLSHIYWNLDCFFLLIRGWITFRQQPLYKKTGPVGQVEFLRSCSMYVLDRGDGGAHGPQLGPHPSLVRDCDSCLPPSKITVISMTHMPYNPSKLSRDCVAANRKKPNPPRVICVAPTAIIAPVPSTTTATSFFGSNNAEVEVVAAEVAMAAAVAAAAATWQLWQRQRQMR
jgi:hypothetical protein